MTTTPTPEPVQLIKGKVLKVTDAWKPLDSALQYALGRQTKSKKSAAVWDAVLEMNAQEYHLMLKAMARCLAVSKIHLTYVDSVDGEPLTAGRDVLRDHGSRKLE